MPRATAYRLLRVLVDEGFVTPASDAAGRYVDDGDWRIGRPRIGDRSLTGANREVSATHPAIEPSQIRERTLQQLRRVPRLVHVLSNVSTAWTKWNGHMDTPPRIELAGGHRTPPGAARHRAGMVARCALAMEE